MLRHARIWIGLRADRGAYWAGVTAIALLTGFPASSAERIPLDGATAEVCFTPGRDCAQVIAEAIGEAKQRVRLLGYGFTSRPVLDALIAADRRGIDVRVILDRSNETGPRSRAAEAAQAGIEVRIDRTVTVAHNKLIVIDDSTVVTGSFNWTTAANTKNAENVHVIRGARGLAQRNATYFLEREAISEPLKAR
jgi:phosphatidylserine/phosphatidylglycerophosphate/cardiolipin synthase-like enzyme